MLRGDPASLAGQTIREVRRHGKFIVMELSSGSTLTLHLGMTGKLLVNSDRTAYTRAGFRLDQGELLFEDIRTFGRIEISAALPERVAALGPDALQVDASEFAARAKTRRSAIKPLLLNQRFLRGLGNIYADEALFGAGIHPRATASRLSLSRLRRLHDAIRQTLRQAIDAGGSSISDYVDADGVRGSFQERHQVYGREGAPCPRCGGPIRRILVAQRGTHFCPRCQKR